MPAEADVRRRDTTECSMTISQIQRSVVGSSRSSTKRPPPLEMDGRLSGSSGKPPSCAVVFKTTAPSSDARAPLNLNMLHRSDGDYTSRDSSLYKTSHELANCRLSKKGLCGLDSCFCQKAYRDNNNTKPSWGGVQTSVSGSSLSSTPSKLSNTFARTSSGYGSLRSRSDVDCGLRILGVKSEYGLRDPASKSVSSSTISKSSCGSDVSVGSSAESVHSPKDWTDSKIWKDDHWDISPVKDDHWKDSITSWRNSALYSWRKESDSTAEDVWKKPKSTPKPKFSPPKSFTVTAPTTQTALDR